MQSNLYNRLPGKTEGWGSRTLMTRRLQHRWNRPISCGGVSARSLSVPENMRILVDSSILLRKPRQTSRHSALSQLSRKVVACAIVSSSGIARRCISTSGTLQPAAEQEMQCRSELPYDLARTGPRSLRIRGLVPRIFSRVIWDQLTVPLSAATSQSLADTSHTTTIS